MKGLPPLPHLETPDERRKRQLRAASRARSDRLARAGRLIAGREVRHHVLSLLDGEARAGGGHWRFLDAPATAGPVAAVEALPDPDSVVELPDVATGVLRVLSGLDDDTPVLVVTSGAEAYGAIEAGAGLLGRSLERLLSLDGEGAYLLVPGRDVVALDVTGTPPVLQAWGATQTEGP